MFQGKQSILVSTGGYLAPEARRMLAEIPHELMESRLQHEIDIEEKLYGNHRTTDVAVISRRTAVENAPKERLRLLGSYREG